MKKRWALFVIILCVNICCGFAWFIFSLSLFEIIKAYANIPAQKQALEDARYLWESTAQDQRYIMSINYLEDTYSTSWFICESGNPDHLSGKPGYLIDGDGLVEEVRSSDYCDDIYRLLGMKVLFDRIAADLEAGPTQVKILNIEYDPTYGYVRHYKTDNQVCRRRHSLDPGPCINEFSIIQYQPRK